MSCCLSSPFLILPFTSKIVPETILAVGEPTNVISFISAASGAVGVALTWVPLDEFDVEVEDEPLDVALPHAANNINSMRPAHTTKYALRFIRDDAINRYPPFHACLIFPAFNKRTSKDRLVDLGRDMEFYATITFTLVRLLFFCLMKGQDIAAETAVANTLWADSSNSL